MKRNLLPSASPPIRLLLGSFLALFLLLPPLPAEVEAPRQDLPSDEVRRLFIGSWQTRMDGHHDVVIMIKPDGRASYFYRTRKDATIHRGNWRVFGDAVFIEWRNGRTNILRSIDGNTIRTTLYLGGFSGVEDPDAQGTASRIPDGEVGAWSVPPTELERRSAAMEEAEGFFGIWEVRDPDDGLVYYILVNDDRTAASSYPKSRTGREGLRGLWNRQGAELHIYWDTGHYQIIRERTQDHVTEFFEPASRLYQSREPVRTRRVDRSAVGSWLDQYESDIQILPRANAFRNRQEANRYFRGDWVLLDQGQPVQEIRVGRFGGLEIQGSNLKGEWRSASDAIYLYWDDGFRAILRPVYLGFTYSIFAPGQPFDGTPTMIYPAVPAEPEKLEEFIALKEQATMRVQAYRDQQQRGGPPREQSRSRWLSIWPFN